MLRNNSRSGLNRSNTSSSSSNPSSSSTSLSQRPVYSFPELKISEILQCMDDLRIPLSENDLSKPHPVTVHRILDSFSDLFMGSSHRDQLGNQPSVKAVVGSLEQPDYHVDSVTLISFYRSILGMLVEIGVEDFSLRDLVRPESQRLKLILSAIINFAKFREEQLPMYQEFNRRTEESLQERDRLIRRFEEISERCNAIMTRRESEEMMTSQIKEESSSFIKTLKELKKEQVALSAELEEFKASKTEIGNSLSQSTFQVSSLQQECMKLKSRIVHSPEKLLQIIEEMTGTINTERVNLEQLDRKSREMQSKLDALLTLEQELSRTVKSLDAIHKDFKEKDQLLMDVWECREAIEKEDLTTKDLQVKESQLARQLALAQDKCNRLSKSQDERRSTLAKQIASLQSEFSAVVEERARSIRNIEANEKAVKELDAHTSELRKGHDTEISQMRGECVTLKARVLSYTGEMKRSLKIAHS